MAGYFHLASAGKLCPDRKAPSIEITATSSPIQFDHSKNIDDLTLQGKGDDAYSPYPESEGQEIGEPCFAFKKAAANGAPEAAA